MNKRPISITVIAWLLIISAIFFLIYNIVNFNDPVARKLLLQNSLPLSIQFLVMYLGLAISLISGIAFLKRQNWARFLYAGWYLIGFIIGFATSQMRMVTLPGFALFLVELFFLFRPKANAYFLMKQDLKEIEVTHVLPKKRRWFSGFRIVFYIASVMSIGTGNMMAFVNDINVIAIVITFSILGFILLLIGLALNRFQKWKRDTGFVLILSACYAAFVAATVGLVSLSSEFRKNLQIPADVFIFNDYWSGVSFIILFAVVGFLMLKLQKS
ncbi:MAG: hypothetical protein L7F78_03920 [Syntrophales bacterium LBB04]|nr:hypothetical protein [Syntrophales bacterium LBB04]